MNIISEFGCVLIVLVVLIVLLHALFVVDIDKTGEWATKVLSSLPSLKFHDLILPSVEDVIILAFLH